MRVVAGKYRSCRLESLRGLDLRPTADRLRETLFDVLTAGNPPALEGTIWLDLFAGTGAVGIEALSRGAATVYFVESSSRAAELIMKNLNSLRIETGYHLLRQEVLRALDQLETRGVGVNFIFLDPPYSQEEAYRQSLTRLATSQLLKPEGMVIAEHPTKFDAGKRFGSLQRFRKLEQGDAALSFYRMA